MAADAREQALFQELILDHYRRPRNRRALQDASGTAARRNPACGEHVEAAVAIDGDPSRRAGRAVVRDAAFTGAACSIATAAASMLSSMLAGLTRDDAADLLARYRGMLGGEPAAPALGDLRALAAVVRYPARLACARLPADAFEAAIEAGIEAARLHGDANG